VLVGVEGIAGHALPALALAAALTKRGHEVRFQSHERWREQAERLGVGFAGGDVSLVPGLGARASAAEVVRGLMSVVDELEPDVIVGDALTVAPTLAAEVASIPAVTLYPEVYPYAAAGRPPFSLGLMPPRSRVGALAWRALAPFAETRFPTTGWLRGARAALNAERAQLGLPPLTGRPAPVSPGMALVATLPELEYPRDWPEGVHVTGPMNIDLPQSAALELPAGDAPLVLVAPSTVKDPERRLVRTTLDALAGEPVRLAASTSGTPPPSGGVPANAVVAEWIDYSEVMPKAALVVSNGTHGTIVRALTAGVPLAIAPTLPDDAEHGVRVAWAGGGLSMSRRPPSARSLRSVVRRILGDPGFTMRARRIAAANANRDGAARGAELIEEYVR
jgi:UDP:flavonoid glycosyltransferase YjiC (YdhE family)